MDFKHIFDKKKQEDENFFEEEVIVEVFDKPIADTGERTMFESGAVRDIKIDKGRMDLIPIDMIIAILDDIYEYDIVAPMVCIRNFMYSKDRGNLIEAVVSFWDTIPDKSLILELSKHFQKGAKKYGEWNWTKGIPAHSYLDSALRHYIKHVCGQNDEPHAVAFVWNIMCLWWTLGNKPELDDIHYLKKENA